MKTFNDLHFHPHPISVQMEEIASMAPSWMVAKYQGCTQAEEHFPNGYGVSVVFGKPFYSNGVDTYEVAVLKGDDIDMGNQLLQGGVIGNQSPQEVSRIMERLQQLPPCE
ncbi:MAG TPA: hypothetical protein H9824_05730 [Candidatus Bacteroides pullicola]|uniref:Uncharacterized protein n=1 Tax=Candidatus Bacteroides pullicola TaxID=2838475 RepID=A0A9D1ZLA0_9BACE|nr:hypothetical protein [Candidatus Bacteroides pullicola]